MKSFTRDAYEILLPFLQNPLTKQKQMFTVMINLNELLGNAYKIKL